MKGVVILLSVLGGFYGGLALIIWALSLDVGIAGVVLLGVVMVAASMAVFPQL